MPDDQAKEKGMLLEKFGAKVEFVKPASIVNSKHYVNEARRRAKQIPGKLLLVNEAIWIIESFVLFVRGLFCKPV
jgi:cysteine synthase